MNPTPLQEDEELEKQVLDIIESHFKPSDNSLMPLNATKQVMQLFKAHSEQKAKYQTYVYRQDHPTLDREIWGIRIAYQGQQIVGDIASSEEKAYEMLNKHLAQLTNTQVLVRPHEVEIIKPEVPTASEDLDVDNE